MVVSVGYRYAPEHRLPAAQEDSYFATQWIMKNAGKWSGDVNRVAVGGESAGGNLATDMCYMAKMRGGKMPIHQMLVYPYVDTSFASANASSARENATVIPLNRAMLTWFSTYILPSKSYGSNPLASPLYADTNALKGMPPATIVQAELDPLRSQGTAYADKLRRARRAGRAAFVSRRDARVFRHGRGRRSVEKCGAVRRRRLEKKRSQSKSARGKSRARRKAHLDVKRERRMRQ